jgi:hypothetical protein
MDAYSGDTEKAPNKTGLSMALPLLNGSLVHVGKPKVELSGLHQGVSLNMSLVERSTVHLPWGFSHTVEV